VKFLWNLELAFLVFSHIYCFCIFPLLSVSLCLGDACVVDVVSVNKIVVCMSVHCLFGCHCLVTWYLQGGSTDQGLEDQLAELRCCYLAGVPGFAFPALFFEEYSLLRHYHCCGEKVLIGDTSAFQR